MAEQTPNQDAYIEETGPSKAEVVAQKAFKKWHYLAIPLVVAVIVMIVLAIQESSREATQNQAYQELQQAETVEQLQAVFDQYPQTDAGMLALKSAADKQFNDGNYSESRALYEKFIATYPEHALNAWLQNSIGYCYEAAGEYEQAIAAYNKVADYISADYLQNQVVFSRGRCYEASGDIEAAKDEYKKLTETDDQQAQKPWANEAAFRLQLLEQ